MLVGVIDLGSNTIRLSVYKCTKGKFSLLLNEKSFVGLAGYVQNGRLNAAGAALACDTIGKYKKLANSLNVPKLFVFGTAAVRNVANTEEIVEQVYRETGLQPDVLTGEEEALFGFAGASHAVSLETGLFVDIGGGSTEIASFENGKVRQEASFPFGCLNLYLSDVAGLVPDAAERLRIRTLVGAELDRLDWLGLAQASALIGVGGTIRALKKFSTEITGVNGGVPLDVAFLDYLLNIVGDPKGTGYRQFLRIVPDRVHTLVPGMLILDEIVARTGAKRIYVSKYGVREGYLLMRVLAGENDV